MPVEPVHWAVTSDAARVYREDLKAAKDLDAGIDRLAAALDNGSKASRRLSSSVLKAGESLKQERRIAQATVQITREWGVSTSTAAKVARRFRGEVDALSHALKREAKDLDLAQKETRELAAAQRKAAGGMSAGSSIAGALTKNLIGLAAGFASVQLAARGVAESIRTFAGLEDQLLGTQAVTRASAAEMQRLSDQAKQLGATTPRTAVEIAGLQQELARAGFTIEETLQSTGGLIAFASAGQLELGAATDYAATILRAFDRDVGQLGNVTDILAVSASGAKTDIGQLASAFEFAAAPAAAIGASLEETSAALAVIQERGVKGTKAGRGLNAVFRELSKETERGTTVLEKAGLTYDDVNISVRGLLPVIETLADKVGGDFANAIELVGSEAAPAFLNLIRGVEKFGELTDENMTRAAGRTQEMADVMESGLGGASRRLKSAAEGLQVAFGEGLAPALGDTQDALSEILANSQGLLRFLGEAAGLALGTTSAIANLAAEMLRLVTASSLVDALGADIAGLVAPSRQAREAWESMATTISAGGRGDIEAALGAARASIISMETELGDLDAALKETETQSARTNKALGFEAAGKSQEEIDALRERFDELSLDVQSTRVAISLYEKALDSAAEAGKRPVTRSEELRGRLADLQKQINAVGNEERIRQEIEERLNVELDESLRRTEDNRQKLLELEIQALSTGQAFDTLADRLSLPGAEGIVLDPIDEDILFADIAAISADYKKTMADLQKETERQVGEAWLSVADIAFGVADAIGGEWGDMLGGLVDGVLGIRDTFKSLQGASGIQALAGGFGLGQQVSGLAGGLGVQQQAGGAVAGLFGAVGTAVGGPVAGAALGFVGSLVESLKIFQQGGDTATAAFELNAGRLEAVTTKLEGGLGQGIEAFSGAVAKSINAILASLGAFVGPGGLADIDIKIRQEGDETLFQVRRFGKTFAKFKDEASAVTEAIRVLLSESDIQGLSENVAAAIRETTAQTFDQLAADIARAQLVDERLMTEGERHLAARTRLLREEIAATVDLGIALGDVLEGLVRQEEALARQAELQALSIAGVDTSLEQGLAALDVLAEQAAQTEALNAAYQAAAEAASAAAAQEVLLGQQRDDLADDYEGLRGTIPGLRERFGDLEDQVAATGQAAEIAVRQIEGVDAALVELSREALVARGLGNFVAQVAELTGNAELAAQAAELQRQAQLITIRLEFERIKALGIVDEALAASIEAAIQQAEALGAAVGAGAGEPARRPGGGGGRRQQREAAAEAFRESIDDIRTQLAGTHPDLLAMAEATEKLREQAREGKIGADELAAGLAALAELQSRQLADLGQQGLADLGGVTAQIRGESAEAAAQIGFLLDNLDALGLTVRDVRVALREGLAPSLLSIAEAEARRVGDLQAAERFAERRAIFERRFERLRFEALVAQLELAGALSPALAEVADEIRTFFDMPDAAPDEDPPALKASRDAVSSFFAIAENEARRAVERTVEGTKEREDAEKALAAVQEQRAALERNLERLRFEALIAELELAGQLTPEMRALAFETRELFEQSATSVRGFRDAVGELGEAVYDYGRSQRFNTGQPAATSAAAESVQDIIRRLTEAAMTDLERAELRFADTMEAIAAATGTAAEKALAAALAEAELARERERIQGEQVAGLQSLRDEIGQAIGQRQAPRAQVQSARSAFESALANLDLGDPSSIQAFEAAARNWRAVVAEYDQTLQGFGGSAAALVSSVDQIIAEALAQVLPPPPPGARPDGVGPAPAIQPPATPPPAVPPPAPSVPSVQFTADFGGIMSSIASVNTNLQYVSSQLAAIGQSELRWQNELRPTVQSVGAAAIAVSREIGT